MGRFGTHGLFSNTDTPINLQQVAQEVAEHDGIVMTQILSLRREDAARLGYDKGEAWRDLIRGKATDIAKAINIPAQDLRWYAALMNWRRIAESQNSMTCGMNSGIKWCRPIRLPVIIVCLCGRTKHSMARNIRSSKPLIYVFCEGESEQCYARFLKEHFEDVAVIKPASKPGLFDEADSCF